MAKKTIEAIVKKQLKWYRFEVIILWCIGALGVYLTVSGIAIYFFVGKLTVSEYLATVSITNFAVSQMRLLFGMAKVLGLIVALVGVAAVIISVDRWRFGKAAYRMAVHIRNSEHNLRGAR